jgi:hypothetical protein
MTYEFRTADGRICCQSDDLSCLCDSCKARAATVPATNTTDHDPMAAYRRGIKPRVVTRTAGDDVYRNPSDGYQLALARQREEAR